MSTSSGVRRIVALAFTTATLVATAGLGSAFAAGQSFTTLAPGFTQELYGTINSFAGGVAFAPDGDPLVNQCAFGGSPLFRFDSGSLLAPVNGTSTLHPQTTISSNAGCGMTNGKDGTVYTNTGSGVVQLDPNTGATLNGPFGPGGNALGIAPDPKTGDMVYVGADGTIQRVDAALTSTSVFSTAVKGHFVDGIYWDPSGNYLFMSDRAPVQQLTILDRTGKLVQSVPMNGVEPDGIAFHASSPQFVVTSNTNGTMTRFDFAGNDFTTVPTQSVFASGGFRGDLGQVGSDGCFYLTQDGVRYDDGTTGSGDSLVRLCPGFAPPLAVKTVLRANPSVAKILTNVTTTGVTVYLKPSAVLTDSNGVPLAGQLITFTAAGKFVCSAKTDSNGLAGCGATLTNILQTTLALGYDASFAGQGTLQPATSHGTLAIVLGISLP